MAEIAEDFKSLARRRPPRQSFQGIPPSRIVDFLNHQTQSSSLREPVCYIWFRWEAIHTLDQESECPGILHSNESPVSGDVLIPVTCYDCTNEKSLLLQ